MATFNDMLKSNNPSLQSYDDSVQAPASAASAIRSSDIMSQNRTARMSKIKGKRATAAQLNPRASRKSKQILKLSDADRLGRLSFYDFANTTIGRLRKKTRSYADYLKMAKGTTVEQQQARTDEMKGTGKESSNRKKRSQKIIDMYQNYLKQRKSNLLGATSSLDLTDNIQSFTDTASQLSSFREG